MRAWRRRPLIDANTKSLHKSQDTSRPLRSFDARGHPHLLDLLHESSDVPLLGLRSVLEPFQRASTTSQLAGKGSGTGLAYLRDRTCRELSQPYGASAPRQAIIGPLKPRRCESERGSLICGVEHPELIVGLKLSSHLLLHAPSGSLSAPDVDTHAYTRHRQERAIAQSPEWRQARQMAALTRPSHPPPGTHPAPT